jgi:hypothetical protein
MICIYHNRDLDGWCSASIVKLKYPEALLIGYDYGQPLPSLPKGEPIIMVDISFDTDSMVQTAKDSGWQLTWIDHHISAINNYKEFIGEGESFCVAVLENDIAACEGTWKYLFPKESIPLGVALLGKYDTWRNQDILSWNQQILPFQFGMKALCNSPETFPEQILTTTRNSEQFVHKITDGGRLIISYQNQINESQCRLNSFEFEFEGLKVICLNGGGFNSDVFKSVYDPNKHDIMMPFQFNGKFWTISLYTTKDEIDCSVLAKNKGGGGHKKAAGFQVKDINSFFKITL